MLTRLLDHNFMKPPLILATKSKNRQRLFFALNLPFKAIASQINEKLIQEDRPGERAKKIALNKATAVAQKHRGIIIAADTFTVCRKKFLEKPKNLSEAGEMLRLLSDRPAVCYTGFCYIDNYRKIFFLNTALTKLWFRKIGDREISGYLKKFPVTAWAAAYAASELYVLGLIKKVSGSLTGLTHGLPLEYLVPLLIKSGYNPRP